MSGHMGRIYGRFATRLPALAAVALVTTPMNQAAYAQQPTRWVTTWATASQGPFPSGAASALPDQSFAFPDPPAGANDQSFRMIVRPSVWAGRMRLRLSNAFGSRPVTFDGVFAGLQLSAAAVAPGTSVSVLFAGRKSITVAPGSEVWSDPVTLPFAVPGAVAALAGRKLAVSFHVVGSSGPMTWHAKAMQTSYASLPRTGSHGGEAGEQAFPMSATAWFFLNAIDMRMPEDTPLIVCFGDSITDGSASTLNGDDRWPDVLQRRLAARYPNGVAVVNEGIGSNQITGPDSYDPKAPFGGGPSALQRMNRDVAALNGVKTVIWFEGINDLSHGQPADAVVAGFRTGIAQLRKATPGVRVIGATITPALGAKGDAGGADVDQKRKAINATIRAGGLFDGYVDFEQAVKDPQADSLKAAFVPNTTIGGPGDALHPNRAGYLAMGGAVDFDVILPGFRAQSRKGAVPKRKPRAGRGDSFGPRG